MCCVFIPANVNLCGFELIVELYSGCVDQVWVFYVLNVVKLMC